MLAVIHDRYVETMSALTAGNNLLSFINNAEHNIGYCNSEMIN